MVLIESASSWGPQENSQSPPPIAQAPKPARVRFKSELPNCRVGKEVAVRFVLAIAKIDAPALRKVPQMPPRRV